MDIKEAIKDITNRIKSRKGLENLDDDLVAERIDDFLKKSSKARKRIKSAEDFSRIARSKDVDSAVKHVRAELRPVYGLFVKKSLKGINASDKIGQILRSHVSSDERLDFYKEFYARIFKITGKPGSIIDIACGLNPFSFEFMGLPKSVKYTALELNQNDADIINDFFMKNRINGKAFRQDITSSPVEGKADIAFAFKIFDLVDSSVTERIINELDVKWIAASFSTKTVSKKDMRFKRRAGFQKMMRRLCLEYRTVDFPNEIVYLINKTRISKKR